jgi:hypothetical protein
LNLRKKNKVSNLIFRDAGKAFFGSAIAVVLALFLPNFIKPVVQERLDNEAAAIVETVEAGEEKIEAGMEGALIQLPELPVAD